MKIGYACINTSLGCTSSSTFRLASYSEDRLRKTVESNLNCLLKILEFNAQNNIRFFRLTSGLIPFASHPINKFPWSEVYKSEFSKIGIFIQANNFRISMHPDQFVVINTPTEQILQNSLRELSCHNQILELLGLRADAKIQIHLGGMYGDRKKAIKRFVKRYKNLPSGIKERLVLENDDRLFDISDCLRVNKLTKIPIVLDVLHHKLNNPSNIPLKKALISASKTWAKKDGIPIVDFSTADPKKRAGSHSKGISLKELGKFIKVSKNVDFDLMIESKDKEKSALSAIKFLKL